jgi:hypothetical protein
VTGRAVRDCASCGQPATDLSGLCAACIITPPDGQPANAPRPPAEVQGRQPVPQPTLTARRPGQAAADRGGGGPPARGRHGFPSRNRYDMSTPDTAEPSPATARLVEDQRRPRIRAGLTAGRIRGDEGDRAGESDP